MCGQDEFTGNDYEYRRGWVEERIKFLAGWFGVEVFAYAVMKNHLHVVVRNNPERVSGWHDEEVARRWLHIFPVERDSAGKPVITEALIKGFLQNEQKVKEVRRRLSSISWFMKCLNEPIAKRANKEDGCKGHFWEGRFYSQSLEDDGALLACMAYVDLNPVRAGEVLLPEESRFTSLRLRCQGLHARKSGTDLNEAIVEIDGWLGNAEVFGERGSQDKSGEKWILPNLKLESYLDLVDWTAKQIKYEGKAWVPEQMTTILERVHLAAEDWVDNICRYQSLFKRVVATEDRMAEVAANWNQQWVSGKAGARNLYCDEQS